MIRIVVVEDSPSARALLIGILESEPEMKVVGFAVDGEAAVNCVSRLSPDVVTMNINMPRMGGIDAIKAIMNICPVPIIVISATCDKEAISTSFEALESGAVATAPKPAAPTSPKFNECRTAIIRTVRLMSEVHVIQRRNRSGSSLADRAGRVRQYPEVCRIAAIGASTGGPPIIGRILSFLDVIPAFPILIVQHISQGFVDGLAAWLQERTKLDTVVAADGERCRNGTVYIAPDNHHMGISINGRIRLSSDPLRHAHRPSVGYLFDSIAASYGSSSLGIILTGMGEDGSMELRNLHDTGADTVAQDHESAVVYGMPGKAIEFGGVTHVLKPKFIAEYIDRKSIEAMRIQGGSP